MSEFQWEFKNQHTFASRLDESQKIRAKYPDRIPVVAEPVINSGLPIPAGVKSKYLVPSDMIVAQFMYFFRKAIALPPELAIVLFVNKVLPTTSATMESIYDEHADKDGFLYIQYSGKNVVE